MKTLDRYILRQLLSITLIGVVSLSTLLLLGQIFKELQGLLIESGAPPSIVFEFIAQVVPFSLTFSLPWGFLTAVLLVYGRLAADNELTSFRMAGLSLWRLSAPAIGLGIALSALCYYINTDVAPRGKQAMTDIIANAAIENPKNLLGSSQVAIKIDKINLYINQREGDLIRGLHVYPIAKKGEKSDFNAMHAREAIIGEFDPETRNLHLDLKDVLFERNEGVATDMPLISRMPLHIHIPISTHRRLKADRFTNAEISDTLRKREDCKDLDYFFMGKLSKQMGQQEPYPAAAALWAAAHQESGYYINSMDKEKVRSFRTAWVKRASFSCACIIFALIGVPLAITARRRDSSTGFALGIIVAAIYFVALIFCETTRESAGITPYIVLWVPNILGLIYAIWLHHRAQYRG